jgi:hypothetical protein
VSSCCRTHLLLGASGQRAGTCLGRQPGRVLRWSVFGGGTCAVGFEAHKAHGADWCRLCSPYGRCRVPCLCTMPVFPSSSMAPAPAIPAALARASRSISSKRLAYLCTSEGHAHRRRWHIRGGGGGGAVRAFEKLPLFLESACAAQQE